MDPEAARIEHLKLIQNVIDRMGRNSFVIKTSTFALSTGLVAATIGINEWLVSITGCFPLASDIY